MRLTKTDSIPIRHDDDVVDVRRCCREWATEIGFGVTDMTRVVTAASELSRNILVHAGQGTMRIDALENLDGKRGLRLVFEDNGPGIPDVDLALRDGYTTRGGMGLGLGGAKRLMQRFEIEALPTGGTRVTVERWQ